ncbi:MAG: efflux RND transporter periplasmic adaptor subunit [Gemmatimonadaceae bacterium]
MRTRMRWTVLVLGVVAVAGIAWWRSSRATLDVETAVVARGAFEETIVEDGRTRVRWHVDVTAPVTGEWRPAELRVGDTVSARALLGTLTAAPADPASARAIAAQLGVADADLSAARATEAATVAAQAEADRAFGRAERLGAAGGVTEEELDRIRTLAEARLREREAARARVAAAVFARDAARAMLPGGGGVVRVTAPDAGVILRLDEEHARVVGAGAPLMMIGATGVLEVVVDVLSTDAGRIPVGAKMRIFNGPDSADAHVLRVEPVAHTVRSALGVDEQRVSVIGDIHAPGSRLGHDYEVRARIVVGRRENALLVPSGALVRDGDAWSVFVVDEAGRARTKPVTVRARGAEQAAIEGLDEGVRVVLHPPESLTDGVRVQR